MEDILMDEVTNNAGDGLQEYLIFTVGSTDFGVDIRLVEEIIEIQPVFKIPNSLGFCKGIINIRGKIVPVIDMRIKLGFDGADYDERASIIVVMLNSEQIGMMVDRVQDVIRISEEDLKDLPLGTGEEKESYVAKISCIDDRINQILDMESLFEADAV